MGGESRFGEGKDGGWRWLASRDGSPGMRRVKEEMVVADSN